MKRRTVRQSEAQLAYHAAAVALGIALDIEHLKQLADTTYDVPGLTYAVQAMRRTSRSALTLTGPTPSIESIVASALVALTEHEVDARAEVK